MYELLNSPSRQCAIIRTLELLPDMHSIVNHLHIHQIPSFDLCVDHFNLHLHLILIHFIEPGVCRVPRLPKHRSPEEAVLRAPLPSRKVRALPPKYLPSALFSVKIWNLGSLFLNNPEARPKSARYSMQQLIEFGYILASR